MTILSFQNFNWQIWSRIWMNHFKRFEIKAAAISNEAAPSFVQFLLAPMLFTE
jgi:hypothetical protein